MPKTLDRPPTTEAPAPPVVEPSKAPPAPKRPTPFVRWLGWLALVVLVAAAGVLFVVQATDDAYVDDGSHLVVEEARMMALLAPVAVADGGSGSLGQKDAIEEMNTALLAPVAVTDDGSSLAVEEARMALLAPVAVTDDGSSLAVEEARMARLAP